MADQPASFEEGIKELEAIVQRLERGQPTLEESLASFERGVGLLRECRRLLESARLRIAELVAIDEDGTVRIRDFEHEASFRAEPSTEDPRARPPRSDRSDSFEDAGPLFS